jgi:hypothetical protein
MPSLRAVILSALGAIAVLTSAGRAMRLLGGDDPREDRAVRGLQAAFGHRPDEAEAAGAAHSGDPTGLRDPGRPGHRRALVVLGCAADHRERGALGRPHLAVHA